MGFKPMAFVSMAVPVTNPMFLNELANGFPAQGADGAVDEYGAIGEESHVFFIRRPLLRVKLRRAG